METKFKSVEWQRPLSAQFGNNPEVMLVPVETPEPKAEAALGGEADGPAYLPVESYPGVRDYSAPEGLVTLVNGKTMTVKKFLGLQASAAVERKV